MNYGFIDTIADHLDFIGVNYYGKKRSLRVSVLSLTAIQSTPRLVGLLILVVFTRY